MDLSVYNLVAHVERMDMTVAQISQYLSAKWTSRGPLALEPSTPNVSAAAARLAKLGHVSIDGETVRCVVRQAGNRGLPLFVEDKTPC